MEERKAMMDLLKRFEDDNLEDPLSDGSDEEDEGASLESRLLGLDLGVSSRLVSYAFPSPYRMFQITPLTMISGMRLHRSSAANL